MKNSDVPELDSCIKNETTQKEHQSAEDETLKVRLNKNQVLLVHKEKLLQKSHYFKSITNSCFADHESEFTEVIIPVSFESFRKVILYVINDIIDISE